MGIFTEDNYIDYPNGAKCDKCGKKVKRLYFYVWGMYHDEGYYFEMRCEECMKKDKVHNNSR